MKNLLFIFAIMIMFLFSSCSSSKYTLPPNVYRSMISPKSNYADYNGLKNLNRNLLKNKKLLIMAVVYDQFDNVDVPAISQDMLDSMKSLTEKIRESRYFIDVQFTTMSHFKIGTVEELSEVCKHFGAEYVLLVNSAYNFYKYSTTWGNFIAWFPVINFMIPFNRFTGTIFVEGTIMSRDGAILFTETVNNQLSENTNILYSREHFFRMSRELHQNSYNKLYSLLVKDFENGVKR